MNLQEDRTYCSNYTGVVLTGLVEYWNDGTAVPKELPKEL
jgi:hypothetical protein